MPINLESIESIPTGVLSETLALANQDIEKHAGDMKKRLPAMESRAVFQKWSAAREMRNAILDELDRRKK